MLKEECLQRAARADALIATIMQAHAFPIPLLSAQGAARAAEKLVFSPEPKQSSQGFRRAKPRLC